MDSSNRSRQRQLAYYFFAAQISANCRWRQRFAAVLLARLPASR